MLRKLRIAVSLIFSVLLTIYIIDFAGLMPVWFDVLAEVQLIPALLALNVAIIVGLLLLTVVFGRVYCSSICPLGVYQDVITWFARKINKKKRFRYRKALTVMRWSFVTVTFLAFLGGFTFLLGLLDPYSAFARIATHVFKPAYEAGNNLLALIFTHFGNERFSQVSVYLLSVFSLIVALVTMVVVGYLAWVNGRIYCNSVCPVGTTLGFFSRFSLFKIRINENKCTSCNACARTCKASCISIKGHQIDASRCINCFDCLEVCKDDAINFSYSFKLPIKNRKKIVNASRRRFMMAVGVTGVAASRLIAAKVPGVNSIATGRKSPISPPGSLSVSHLLDKCTSCHLCVTKCPCQIIKPSFLEYGIGGIMQPMLTFENDYCTYDCTICSDVCPTGALQPLTVEQKKLNKMGDVHFVMENCIVFTDETDCGRCYNRCPTDAIQMVDYKGELSIPEVDSSLCVGCGGCEYICPAEPNKAIFVEGIAVHRVVKQKPKEAAKEADSFGF
jgi:ferredoxin